MYGDESATLYVDNVFVLNATLPNVVSANISVASRLFAVRVINQFLKGGILLSFKVGGCITDSVSWRCTNISYPNWYQTDFDDKSWPLAVSQTQNGFIITGQKFPVNCPVLTYSVDNRAYQNLFYCRHWIQ